VALNTGLFHSSSFALAFLKTRVVTSRAFCAMRFEAEEEEEEEEEEDDDDGVGTLN
jgi:hypothetical protein